MRPLGFRFPQILILSMTDDATSCRLSQTLAVMGNGREQRTPTSATATGRFRPPRMQGLGEGERRRLLLLYHVKLAAERKDTAGKGRKR